MSCGDCEQIQAGPRGEECYVRVGVSNMLIVGCRTHLADLLAALRFARSHESEWKSRDNGTITEGSEQ